MWSVPYVGTVVDGIINSGRLKAGDAILFGPDSNGKFESTAIKTIQRKRYASYHIVLEAYTHKSSYQCTSKYR